MSLPQFPTISPPLTREEAINQIISSIAMEELGISHIINAEGEKLQYVLGTIEGKTGPNPTIDEVLKVNESVRAVLQSAAESQSLLRSKLQNALTSAVLIGPTGATGGTGTKGEPGEGAILAFSSGSEVMDLPVGTGGAPDSPVLVGIGSNDEWEFSNGNIDLAASSDVVANYTFIVPRAGTISNLTAYFYTDKLQELDNGTGTVHARLYRSEATDNNRFTRIADVTLKPDLTSTTPAGTILYGTAGDIPSAGIPLVANTRLLLTFEAHATGSNTDIAITGFGSASVAIS